MRTWPESCEHFDESSLNCKVIGTSCEECMMKKTNSIPKFTLGSCWSERADLYIRLDNVGGGSSNVSD